MNCDLGSSPERGAGSPPGRRKPQQLGRNSIPVSAIIIVFVEGLGAESVGAFQGLK